MSTLLQYLPVDLQTELARIEHAAKLKEVQQELLAHVFRCTDYDYDKSCFIFSVAYSSNSIYSWGPYFKRRTLQEAKTEAKPIFIERFKALRHVSSKQEYIQFLKDELKFVLKTKHINL
jgi:hypothetical protein